MKRIAATLCASRSLAALRDMLLPQLIFGDGLRVVIHESRRQP